MQRQLRQVLQVLQLLMSWRLEAQGARLCGIKALLRLF
jgi:hypothetical protein